MLHQTIIHKASYYPTPMYPCAVECYLTLEDMNTVPPTPCYWFPFTVSFSEFTEKGIVTSEQKRAYCMQKGELIYNEPESQEIITLIEEDAADPLATQAVEEVI